ncbi:hypothetical protein H9Q13_10545 [Pontibacter sp. JH31]|uniref:Polysaccharide biosynthesis protein C-terminal domain-containing protein n=1 Tax=Pontibacter aquaedesilientis TaxID=2766980 RepID=A0ABR7XI18_9BACT|nr:hypothetical protein [Pontibacter aquaedesilientis]MBD1397606.1 hypothetical protein [Pontibacter aquaedesilientis]
MFRRIAITGSLTGLAHFLSLFSLGVAVRFLDNDQIGNLAQIDANLLLITAIVSFGLQIATTRDIALSDNWQDKLRSTQSARFTLSLLLVAYGFIEIFITRSTSSLVFLTAPFIALNADYALYGTGKPIIASLLSFVRVLIPGLFLIIISVFFAQYIEIGYLIGATAGLLISGRLVSKSLDTNYLQKINRDFVKKYLLNYKIGLASLSITLLELGQISIARFFYDDLAITNVYMALKLYILYRGAQRLVIQSFYRDINDNTKSISLDNFGIIIGFLFLIISSIYSKTTIYYLYGQEYVGSYLNFIILGITALLSSILTTGSPKILLLKKDHAYFSSYIISSSLSLIVTIGLSYTSYASYGIATGILIGETCLLILFTKHLGGFKYLKPRLAGAFMLGLFLLVLIYSTNWINVPQLYIAFLNIILFTLFSLALYSKLFPKFKLLS